jgi:hypothetical protein
MIPTREQPGERQKEPQATECAALGERKQTQAGAPPTRPWLERMDIIAKLVLSLAGLILSGVIGYVTISYNRWAAERQIQNQIESLELQRRATAAQILVSQMPNILRGKEQERTLILKVLEAVDPNLVRQIGEGLLAQASSPAAAEQAKRVIASSVTTAREYAFAQHVENARKYLGFGLFPAAAREYMKAYEALPASLQERHAKQIGEATKDYDSGNHEGAVRRFEEALRGVKAPFSQ